jgi:hypothetical protein
MLGPANAARIRAISVEIELLWEALRRERATRRVQLERALNVVSEDNDDSKSSENSDDNESQTARVSSTTPRRSRKSRKSTDSTDAA